MANSTPSFDDVHAALECMGRRITGNGEWLNTNCPAHEDRNPSFGIKRAPDGGAITKCQAGCNHADILASLGFARRNKTSNLVVPTGNRRSRRKAPIVEEYKYTDAAGALVYWNYRRADKSFSVRRADGEWTRPDGKLPLYGLPEIAEAPGTPVVYVEGEIDVATWRLHFGGLVTTWGIGAGNWKYTDHSPVFGREVLLVSDADEPGRKAMRELAAHLHENGCTVEIALADGDDHSDVTDWVERLGADNARTAIRDATEAYRPTSGYHPRRRSPDAEVEHHLMTIQRIAKGGITFTCRGLSDLVPNGLFPGEYVILAARPGVGKTTLMVVETAGQLRAGRAVLYVNLDSHDSVHYARVCAAFRRETWASYFSTKKNDLESVLRGFADSVGERFVQLAGRWTPSELQAEAQDWLGAVSGTDSLIVGDTCNRLRPDGNRESQYERHTAIAEALPDIARTLNVPILTLTHFNGASVGTNPSLADLANTGAAEQVADRIIGLTPREPKAAWSPEIEMTMLKDRFPLGKPDGRWTWTVTLKPEIPAVESGAQKGGAK